MINDQIPQLLSWSGGKDSAMALQHLMDSGIQSIELFTTINQNNQRVAMHGYNEILLDKQAESIGLKLHKIYLPDPCTHEDYARIMQDFIDNQKSRGVQNIYFGDLFLEDIRIYRENSLKESGLKPNFPLWLIPTSNLALQFIKKGFKAILTCVDTRKLPEDFSGRYYNMDLLGELPIDIDPCGENGEFHTFVFDGPIFKYPINFTTGKKVIKYDHFCYTDLID